MIDWHIYLPACFALNLAFGPNNLLAMTHGARHGVIFAQRATLGRLAVFVPMIAASALGMGLILQLSSFAFSLVKAAGAIYLIWIGISLWRNAATAIGEATPTGSQTAGMAFRAEAFVAMGNPKAILIFAAFFPQFVDAENYWESYVLIGLVFLALEAVAALIYAIAGGFASRITGGRLSWLQRVSGALMCLFGILLLLSGKPPFGLGSATE